ncbi:hypothetical protein OS493_005713 [Desmophyllum pertusum]|uniref:Uncharacterized protein n=1 Tax=Desmophyllum pertusum TaxID=174260 RepID=A0A9X0CFQ9_9CNID|nr:hypothetical protein OS493_005713 [Desmophyllum pertusum]
MGRDAHGACSSTVDEYSPATGDGVAADDDPAIGESGDDLGDEELSSHHYRRLQRAEDAWSKLREAVISTTLQNQGFLAGKKCCVCSMVANCRCLDCSPTMSLCESCASDQHKVHNIFHHVEILRVSNCNIINILLVIFSNLNSRSPLIRTPWGPWKVSVLTGCLSVLSGSCE